MRLAHGFFAIGLLSCATSAQEEDLPSGPDGTGKADGVELGVMSPNARPGARYMAVRSVEALRRVGALPPLLDGIVRRIAAFEPRPFGVQALLFAEQASRYATFLPEERAAFPQLWQLLEIDDSIDLMAPGAFPGLDELVKIRRPEAAALNTSARVNIAQLPVVLQDTARRVIKQPGADPNSIAFSEVTRALDEYQSYTSNEYFRFGTLLRTIEGALTSPASFPHLEYLGDPAQTATVALDGAAVVMQRSVQESCDRQYQAAGVNTSVVVSFTIPNGTLITWTPLSSGAHLFPSGSSYQEQFSLPSLASTTFRVAGGQPHALAIVEAWQGGAQVAQQLAVIPSNETVGGEGLAIAQNGQFKCLPFADQAGATDSLPDVGRLPPGRYPVPAGTYGPAVLNLFGLGVMRLDLGGRSFWQIQKPTPSSSVSKMCWELTALGPRNMVTDASGPGPGFRHEYQSGKIYFHEQSYGICSGYGTLAATLTESDRL